MFTVIMEELINQLNLESSVNELWDSVLKIGYHSRHNNHNGLDTWLKLKKKLSTFTDLVQINPCFRDIMSKIIYQINTDKEEHTDVEITIQNIIMKNTIETNHFFIQHFRIVTVANYKLPFTKLLQIAYNAGQFRAEEERNTYDTIIAKFYTINRLADIDTFILQ